MGAADEVGAGTSPERRRGQAFKAAKGHGVFAVDCDRTMTGPDLIPDPRALAAIANLRGAGVTCILVTGRTQEDLARFDDLPAAFDAYVLEGGALWGTWGGLTAPSNVPIVLEAARRVHAEGVPLLAGQASFSCGRVDLEKVLALAEGCSFQLNVDRVDILPPGVDKGVGLDAVLGRLGLRSATIFAIGDGENDVPLFARATIALAVANAHPALKAEAHRVLHGMGPEGVVEAAELLLSDGWRSVPQ